MILLEVVPGPERCFGLFVLMGEIVLPSRAEIDVPAPETAEDGFGIPVIMCAEPAVLAGVLLCCHTRYLDCLPQIYEKITPQQHTPHRFGIAGFMRIRLPGAPDGTYSLPRGAFLPFFAPDGTFFLPSGAPYGVIVHPAGTPYSPLGQVTPEARVKVPVALVPLIQSMMAAALGAS